MLGNFSCWVISRLHSLYVTHIHALQLTACTHFNNASPRYSMPPPVSQRELDSLTQSPYLKRTLKIRAKQTPTNTTPSKCTAQSEMASSSMTPSEANKSVESSHFSASGTVTLFVGKAELKMIAHSSHLTQDSEFFVAALKRSGERVGHVRSDSPRKHQLPWHTTSPTSIAVSSSPTTSLPCLVQRSSPASSYSPRSTSAASASSTTKSSTPSSLRSFG